MSIEDNLNNLSSSLPEGTTLVAVSKRKPTADILKAYNAGQRIFGENRVQELAEKHLELPKDIEWHAIGHLQRNKVKYIAPFVSLIHSVDTIKLLNTIESEGAKNDRVLNCLLQIHIGAEETKTGFTEAEVKELLRSGSSGQLSHVKICGLMGMATNTDDEEQIRKEFRGLKAIFDTHKNLEILSMGMSGDYAIAVEEGSNMIRVGSLIFGQRD